MIPRERCRFPYQQIIVEIIFNNVKPLKWFIQIKYMLIFGSFVHIDILILLAFVLGGVFIFI